MAFQEESSVEYILCIRVVRIEKTSNASYTTLKSPFTLGKQLSQSKVGSADEER